MNPALFLSLFVVFALCALAVYHVFFSDSENPDSVTSTGVVPPAPPTPPEPPKEEELSCFVKGLIRSMKEYPREWTRCDGWPYPLWNHPLDIILSKHNWYENGDVVVVGHVLTLAESRALDDAFMTYLENPAQDAIAKRRAEADAKDALYLAAQRASFEKLGCPSSPDSTNSTT